MAKVYVASSWSNEYQPRIVAFLRERGHEVYDFRNPERKTDFCWSQISGNWEKMELMYNLFDGIFPTVADVARFLKEFDEMNNHAVV